MKAIVSKVTGETLLFIPEEELELVKDRKDILIFPAVRCKCGHGWLVKRKKEQDENY
jgi:hypothetical protein